MIPCFDQLNATLSGAVYDETGATIPGASVTATEITTGVVPLFQVMAADRRQRSKGDLFGLLNLESVGLGGNNDEHPDDLVIRFIFGVRFNRKVRSSHRLLG